MREIKPYHQNFTFLGKPIKISEQVWAPDVTPFLSISCITYNHEKFIRDAIEGFLMQETTFPVEILVHDDASTDSTANIIREYEQQYPQLIKPIYQTENQYQKKIKIGPTYQYPRAKGKYLAVCEGDDYWIYESKLQEQVQFLEKHENIVFCCHAANKVDEEKETIQDGITRSEIKFYSKLEILHGYFPTLSLVYRNVGLVYPESFLRDVFNGDAVLTGMLSEYGGAAYLNFVGACYRVHDGGVHSTKDMVLTHTHSIKTRKVMLNSGYFGADHKRELRKVINIRRLKIIKYCIKQKRFYDAFKALFV